MPERKPSRPWRVHGRDGTSTDHRSERAVFDAAMTLARAGQRATVWHWEHGRWGKYEVIEPAEVATTDAAIREFEGTTPVKGEGR